MTDNRNRKLTWGITIAAVMLCLGGIWYRPLYAPDEVSFALTAREMLVSGAFFRTTLNGLPEFSYPAPAYWAAAGALKIFGESVFAVRFPAALFTLLAAGAVYLFCLESGCRRYGVISSMLYLGTGGVSLLAGWCGAAPLSSFCTLCAVLAVYLYFNAGSALKRWGFLLGGGVLAGVGAMVTGLAVPVTAAAVFLFYGLSLKAYRACLAGFFALLAAAVLPAAGAGTLLNNAAPGFWDAYFENSIPVLSGVNLLYAAAGTFPVILLLPALLKKREKEYYQTGVRQFALISLLVCGIIFVFAGNDSLTLALPVYPFFALLLADGLIEAEKEGRISEVLKALRIFCTVLGGAVVLFAVWHWVPAIPLKWRLYSQFSSVPVLMVTGLLLLWYNMTCREQDRYPERKFLYFCIGTAVLCVSAGHLIPFRCQRKFDQTEFIRRAVQPRLLPGARIFADSRTAPAAAWVLHRNVERCFPSPEKHETVGVTLEPLKKIIKAARKEGRQVVILSSSKAYLSELPARRTTIRSGSMTVVIYGDFLK